MPYGMVRLHLSAIPKLKAEEAIMARAVAMLAAGTMDEKDAERTLKSWRKAAGIVEPKAPRATPADLAGMGIAVEKRRKS